MDRPGPPKAGAVGSSPISWSSLGDSSNERAPGYEPGDKGLTPLSPSIAP